MSDQLSEFDLPPGTQVGEYEVQEVLGRGGIGTVYAAEHRKIHKRAAIKVVSAHFAGNEELWARFLREAQVVNKIRHPGLVDIFSFGELPGGRAYLVMELLEGEPLSNRLKREPLRLSEIREIFSQILDALDAAHVQGVIHRDLKPENIFLCQTRSAPRPKLLDFGIAKDLTGRAMTRTGIAMGTPIYMSPEQCRGKDVDHRTDLYALGVMLYEVVTGQPPFVAESVLDLLNQHLSDPPPPIGQFVEIPKALDALIQKALAKGSGERFQSAAEMREALIAALGGESADVLVRLSPSSKSDPATKPTLNAASVPLQELATKTPTPTGEPVSLEQPLEQSLDQSLLQRPLYGRTVMLGVLGMILGGLLAIVLWLRPPSKAPTPIIKPQPPVVPVQLQPQPQPQIPPPVQPQLQPQPKAPLPFAPVPDDPPQSEPAVKKPAPRPTPRPAARPKATGSLLVITGLSSAEVFLDGQPRGHGAQVKLTNLTPGIHRVSVGAPMYQDHHMNVGIQPNGLLQLRITLAKRPPQKGSLRHK